MLQLMFNSKYIKTLNLIFIIVLVILALGSYFLGRQQQASVDDRNVQKISAEYQKSISDKEREIKFLISDTAEPVKTYTVPYSFKEFGLFSSLFKDKNITVEEYKYKRASIRKMSITITIPTTGTKFSPTSEDSNYLIEIWKNNSPNALTHVVTNYDLVFRTDDKNIKVTPIRSIEDAWKDSYYNGYGIKWYSVELYLDSPHINSLETAVSVSPSGPLFARIRPATYLYYTGTFAYDSDDPFLEQITKNLKEIGSTISNRTYELLK